MAPGIDLVDRLAKALGSTANELLPTARPPETHAILREQAKKLFDALLHAAERETLLMLCPLLARLVESTNRSK